MYPRLHRMKRLLLLLAAALSFGAIVPAQATEIGDIISFTAPTVGCTNFADTTEAVRLRTLYGPYAAKALRTVWETT
jgi:hypothetical protein